MFFKDIYKKRKAIPGWLVRKVSCLIPNDELYLRIQYLVEMRSVLHLKHPVKFTEKIQWLKLYNRKTEYITMVDKHAVKDYVANIIGKEYIIPTLGVWDRFDDIDFDQLPDQFVLKTTHGGGGISVVICRNKATFDREKARQLFKKAMKSDIYKDFREWPYKNVPKRIIAEKFMTSAVLLESKANLENYKFFCFDGEPRFLYVSDSPNHKLAFLNTDWTPADFRRDDYYPLDKLPKKPDNLDEMLDIARRLSSNKPHVRVDLYNINNHIYFGELTLYTGSEFIPFNPREYDNKLGNLLTLPNAIGGDKYLIINKIIKPIDTENKDLLDYKFFCFNGEMKFFKIDFGRFVEHHANYYSRNGEYLDFGEVCYSRDPMADIQLPDNLSEMISLAERLSKDIPLLRVDLYNIHGKIYFGELTFFPAAGMGAFDPEEYDIKLGKLLRIKT